MGVVCAKSSDVAASRSDGFATELRKPPPKCLIVPPKGTLEVMQCGSNTMDQRSFTKQHYAILCQHLKKTCLRSVGGFDSRGEAIDANTVVEGSGGSYQGRMLQTLQELATGTPSAGKSVTTVSVNPMTRRSPSLNGGPTPSEGSLYNSAPQRTSSYSQPDTLEEMFYKLMLGKKKAADDDDNSDDEHRLVNRPGKSPLVNSDDDDQFDYNDGKASPPTFSGSGRLNVALLHAGYGGGGGSNPAKSPNIAKKCGDSFNTGGRRGSYHGIQFPLDLLVTTQLRDASDCVELGEQFPRYFSSASVRNLDVTSFLLPRGGEYSARPFGAPSQEAEESFLSFQDRSEIGTLKGREDFFQCLKSASRLLSKALLPVVLHVAASIAKYVNGKRGKSTMAARRPPQGRRNSNNPSDSEAESIDECVRLSLQAYWLGVEGDMATILPPGRRLADVFPEWVGKMLRLLFLCGGGWASIAADDRRLEQNEDMLLADALTVEAINVVAALTRSAGFDGFKGMHSSDEVEQWTTGLKALFLGIGVLPADQTRECREFDQWIQHMPLYAFGEDGKQTMLYLSAVVSGQRKLTLQPVMRADALRSLTKLLLREGIARTRGSQEQQSYRVFPIFATEGVGLESGEGHGPRKELFDLSSVDMTSNKSQPIDISSAATFQLITSMKELSSQRIGHGETVPGSTAGKPVLLISWRQRKLIAQFRQGDVITVNVAQKRDNASDPDESLSASSPSFHPNQVNDCWTVELMIGASNPNESIVVLANPQAKIPYGYRVVSCKVESKRNPPFRHDAGQPFGWLNPTAISTAKAQSREARTDASDEYDAKSRDPKMVMFTCGWVLANAVPNGLVAPATLPPFVFRFLRHQLALLHKHQDMNAESYQASANDLSLVNPSMLMSCEQTLTLPKSDFDDLLLADGLPPSTSKEQYVNDVLVVDSMWNSGDAEASRELLLQLAHGFATSPLAASPLVRYSSCSKQLRSIFCGAIDDGTANFEFQEHFRIIEDREMTQFHHGVLFRDILFDVMETGFEAAGKRQLLKFITGRTLLPPRRKAEHIKIECPLAPMVAKEFDLALKRLPSSHSCDNVLEVHNILEGLIFGSKSSYYNKVGKKVGSVVMDDAKEGAWFSFTPVEQDQLLRQTKDILRRKLLQAVTFSGTYELDEGAVSKATREAFEKAHAGPVIADDTNNNGPIFDVHGTPTRHSSKAFIPNQTGTSSSGVYNTATSSSSKFLRKQGTDDFDEPTEQYHPSIGVTAVGNSSSGMLLQHSRPTGPSTSMPSLTNATSKVTPQSSVDASARHLVGLPPISSNKKPHQHLAIFDRNQNNDDTMAMDIDCDDLVELKPTENVTAAKRGGDSSATVRNRAGDLDNLMSELFPAKR